MSFIKDRFDFDSSFPFALFETHANQVMIHVHDFLEINLIQKGSGHYIIENKTYSIAEGDIFIINNSEHHMAVHDGSLSLLVFVFKPRFIWEDLNQNDYLGVFFKRSDSFSHQITPSHEQYEEYRSLIRRIAEEYHSKQAGWQMILKASLLLFLGELNRNLLTAGTLSRPGHTPAKSYEQVRPVVEYIHEHFDRPITLDELSRIALMNRSYLSTYFAEVMKINISDYISHVRVNHGKMLLKTTDLPISAIALESGFNSISYFNRLFKRITGTSPLQYRKESEYRTSFLE
jgi:AraC-like DNA-binding protein